MRARELSIGTSVPFVRKALQSMASQENEDQSASEWSGWSQFTTQKRKMICDFQIFKDMGENRPTETDKGRYAEALFRSWLDEFLPARYGVTSGYIISQRDSTVPRSALKGKLRHYDVIIYNKLDAPVLWTEISPDHSMTGRIRAIPVEHVHAVLEIKSTLNAEHIADAFKKLDELAPLLALDEADERYKRYLPANFCMGMIFFELPESAAKLQLLNKLVPTNLRRGFFGGIVLSAKGVDQRNTARFRYFSDSEPLSLAKIEGRTLTSIAKEGGGVWSDSVEVSPGVHLTCMFDWSASNFSMFAFDLIAMMNGTYDPGRGSSWHGLTFRVYPE